MSDVKLSQLSCNNETDAYTRVALARLGSLANPTEEYLFALRRELFCWITSVDSVIRTRREKLEE